MDPTRHHVARLRWQARAPDAPQALALRRLLRERSADLSAAMQRAFDDAVPATEVWRLPRLTLRVHAADVQALDADFDATVAQSLRDALADLPAPPFAPVAPSPPITSAAAGRTEAPRRQQRDDAAVDAFWHYVDAGLPDPAWAGADPPELERALGGVATRAAEAAIADDAGALAALQSRHPLPQRLGALLRWLALLSPALRTRWVGAHRPAPPWSASFHPLATTADAPLEVQALWLAWPRAEGPPAGAADRRAVGTWLAAPRSMPEDAVRTLRTAWAAPTPDAPARSAEMRPAATPVPSTRALAADGPPDITAAEPDTLVAPLAGLVLLHPYLPRLLAGCGLLSVDGRQLPPAALPRACALLHALAHGDGPTPEHQLPLIKLLLGAEPTRPLDAAVPALRPADHEEVDALLASACEHWSALRGSGPQALRVSFLQRAGLLDRHGGGWRLRLQSEAFDVLLGLLPWSIGLVRLPWMPAPLGVEWPTP